MLATSPTGQGVTLIMNSISSDDPQKQCTKCLNFFPATPAYFNKHRLHKDGLASQCKKCRGNGTTLGTYKEKEVRPNEKQCPDCLEWLPKNPNFFQVNKSLKDGFTTRCKQCQNKFRKGYYASKDEYIKTRERQHMHQYYESNREEIGRINRAYYAAHQEHARQDKKRYRKDNYDRLHSPEYYEQRRQYTQKWKQRPGRQEQQRELYRVQSHRRRALKRAIAGSCTPEQIREQYDRQKGKCYYCRKYVKWGKHDIEHTFPLSRVIGTDIPANSIDYLVISCESCNSKKHNK